MTLGNYPTLLCTRDGAIATITLNRPDKLNALNEALLTDVFRALTELDRDASVRAAVLTGAGDKAFAAGADIEAMSHLSTTEAKAFAELGHAVGARIEEAHFPVIGAVNGFALGGGCELALICDFLYASEKAKFGQPEVSVGVVPGFGGTARLARRVGIGRAREMCFTGDMIGADEALRIGLVNAVVPHAELLGRAVAAAKKIASRAPLAVAQCKRVLLRGEGLPLAAACELEAQAFAVLFGTADQREGMKAFLEKRPAKFEGR
jgi:enoyl-CoA hydratase